MRKAKENEEKHKREIEENEKKNYPQEYVL